LKFPSFTHPSLIRKVLFARRRATIFTKSRNSTIIPFFKNRKFAVYNGKTYVKVSVSSAKIGKKLGEFSFTKKLGRFIHNTKNASLLQYKKFDQFARLSCKLLQAQPSPANFEAENNMNK